MARNLSEIQLEITNKYVAEMATIGYTVDVNNWSAVNIQRLFIYVVAFCILTLEKLFDTFKIEVENTIKNDKPGSKDWIKNMVLNFQYGFDLIEGTDQFDNTNMSQQDIEESKVVKYCAVTDAGDILAIKVAAAEGDDLVPLSNEELTALQIYLGKIMYAGVGFSLINIEADSIRLQQIQIYYNPMILSDNGVQLASGVEVVESTIKSHLKSIDFNGIFSLQTLQDSLQKVNGVVLVNVGYVYVKSTYASVYTFVPTYCIPASGYFKIYEIGDLNISFLPYAN